MIAIWLLEQPLIAPRLRDSVEKGSTQPGSLAICKMNRTLGLKSINLAKTRAEVAAELIIFYQ